MVAFDPEKRPGQFGLNIDESDIVECGLERQALGGDPIPDANDLTALHAWADSIASAPAVLDEVDPMNLPMVALVTLRQESRRLLDEHATTILDLQWFPNELAATIKDALAVGVEVSSKQSSLLYRKSEMENSRSAKRIQLIASAAASQLANVE